MRDNFELATEWLLVHEGGYVHHPKDPGGATNLGVTQRVYDAWRGRLGLETRSVRHVTKEDARLIYKQQYWDKVAGDALPAGVDYCTYDYAVHSGPGTAARALQEVLGVTVDGVIGAVTLKACEDADPADAIKRLCDQRLAFMEKLKGWSTFKKGWKKRLFGAVEGIQTDDIGVVDRATFLARGVVASAPTEPVPGAAMEDDEKEVVKIIKTLNDASGTITVVGGTATGLVTAIGGADWRIGVAMVVVIAAAGAVVWFTKRKR